jgi:ABC-type sugar transport system permease subunit
VIATRRETGRWAELRRYRHFYLFVSPFFILFAVFGLYPLLFSLYLSFVKWDGMTEPIWVGVGNFRSLLYDELLWRTLWNTLVIGFLYVPPMMILAFTFAQILNLQWLKLRAFFRAAFFLPCVTPMVVIALVFGLFFSSEKGLLNYLLSTLDQALHTLHLLGAKSHLGPIAWTNSEDWSKISIAILVIWRWTGYNMVLMLAGLQGISEDYYEAAAIDGASPWQKLRYITLPLMRPVFRFCGILSLLGTVYMFDEIFVLTQGGPGTSSTNFGLYLFLTSFQHFRFGYASCMAYTVAGIVFLLALLVNRWNRSDAEVATA